MPADLQDNPKGRGTTLFEEFEGILPYLSRLDECGELEFTKAVQLLVNHFGLSEVEVDRTGSFKTQPIVVNLRGLLDAYLQKTMAIPSAIFVVMAYLESTYLEGEDAGLVHKLTGLHVARAKSMKQPKRNPENPARAAARNSRSSRKNSLLAALTSSRRAAKLFLRQA
jgi:hypothetical protein